MNFSFNCTKREAVIFLYLGLTCVLPEQKLDECFSIDLYLFPYRTLFHFLVSQFWCETYLRGCFLTDFYEHTLYFTGDTFCEFHDRVR